MDINSQRTSHASTPSASSAQSGNKKKLHKFWKLSSIVLLFSGTILVVALLFSIVFSGSKKPESNYVNPDNYQAVFLNGGQVYFGKITELNNSYLTLQDIYYLQVDQQVQPDRDSKSADNNITLVKLGCELHGPQDLMVVKQDQIIFWENLKDDGKVAQAVKQFKSQNPDGLKCAETETKSNN